MSVYWLLISCRNRQSWELPEPTACFLFRMRRTHGCPLCTATWLGQQLAQGVQRLYPSLFQW
jgi:hypothetical protein